jgi:phosphoribosylamine--glycine ligase
MSDRVLVLGGGGREHSLAWKLAQSPSVGEVVCAPGNPGTESFGDRVAIDPCDPAAVVALARRVDAALVVVGPEEPAVRGVVDALEDDGRLAFGPRAAAARLEGSKAWMKEVLVSAGVPTARHRTFGPGELELALAHLDSVRPPYVIKTDGLAAGKGVAITETLIDARETVRAYLSGSAFAGAGCTCVIEDAMTGPELSLFALCDGRDAVVLGCAQDYKRIGDGDTGPNTGGIGAVSPVALATGDLVDEVMAKAIRPTLEELARRDAPYRGALYCGLMLTADGPKVVEYNVRFGDPECQILVRRLPGDLYPHLVECAEGSLATPIRLGDDAAVIVVVTASGYPGTPRTGDVIDGLDRASALDGVLLFHAGTTRRADGALVTAGGRVVGVTATAPDVHDARAAAYRAVEAIEFDGMHYRRDIAAPHRT